MKIHKESCTAGNTGSFQEGITRKSLLPDVVNSVTTLFYGLQERKFIEFFPDKDRLSVFLFTSGRGIMKLNGHELMIDEVALFVPGPRDVALIISKAGGLGVLQIQLELSLKDHAFLEKKQNKLPYFITYSCCKRYREVIKSKKTINRTLLPDHVVPRLCIGSVETTGPDQIEPHSHPELEQFFFGLDSNHCRVTADTAISGFRENDFLHIPSGSVHGVTVEAGHKLHYVWIDIFRNLEDMSYIKDHHLQIDD